MIYKPPYVQEGMNRAIFIKPELLTHPNIPKPLHGINPRTIKGDIWWNEVRQIAYKKNNYCCWACGMPKSMALYHQWLEAHEEYKIDYSLGSCEFIDVVALCHTCHNFIHSGRLWMLYMAGKVSKQKITDIIEYGMTILENHKLSPFYGTKIIQLRLKGWNDADIYQECERLNLNNNVTNNPKWEDWHMIIDNKKYYSKFDGITSWAKYYKDNNEEIIK